MTTAPPVPPLHAKVTVALPATRAFDFFTTSFSTWWPTDYHIGQADLAEAVVEPREGGRWYERGVDGSECDWGRVLVWEPPHRLVVTWQINGSWQYDPDPAHASEIEVRFTEDGPDQTTVEIEHRHLDRLVAGQALRDGLVEGGDWRAVLELFAKAATSQQ
ncbi:SRPBCC family protein [Catellatospora paridis]|uniref:SRPBCC family protein n=1 Tax=Catellatospora paridis TaxID=1617086 RepID=UPI0012D3AFE0|nr:SRPBCC family protein [Catellatospora paridis]